MTSPSSEDLRRIREADESQDRPPVRAPDEPTKEDFRLSERDRDEPKAERTQTITPSELVESIVDPSSEIRASEETGAVFEITTDGRVRQVVGPQGGQRGQREVTPFEVGQRVDGGRITAGFRGRFFFLPDDPEAQVEEVSVSGVGSQLRGDEASFIVLPNGAAIPLSVPQFQSLANNEQRALLGGRFGEFAELLKERLLREGAVESEEEADEVVDAILETEPETGDVAGFIEAVDGQVSRLQTTPGVDIRTQIVGIARSEASSRNITLDPAQLSIWAGQAAEAIASRQRPEPFEVVGEPRQPTKLAPGLASPPRPPEGIPEAPDTEPDLIQPEIDTSAPIPVRGPVPEGTEREDFSITARDVGAFIPIIGSVLAAIQTVENFPDASNLERARDLGLTSLSVAGDFIFVGSIIRGGVRAARTGGKARITQSTQSDLASQAIGVSRVNPKASLIVDLTDASGTTIREVEQFATHAQSINKKIVARTDIQDTSQLLEARRALGRSGGTLEIIANEPFTASQRAKAVRDIVNAGFDRVRLIGVAAEDIDNPRAVAEFMNALRKDLAKKGVKSSIRVDVVGKGGLTADAKLFNEVILKAFDAPPVGAPGAGRPLLPFDPEGGTGSALIDAQRAGLTISRSAAGQPVLIGIAPVTVPAIEGEPFEFTPGAPTREPDITTSPTPFEFTPGAPTVQPEITTPLGDPFEFTPGAPTEQPEIPPFDAPAIEPAPTGEPGPTPTPTPEIFITPTPTLTPAPQPVPLQAPTLEPIPSIGTIAGISPFFGTGAAPTAQSIGAPSPAPVPVPEPTPEPTLTPSPGITAVGAPTLTAPGVRAPIRPPTPEVEQKQQPGEQVRAGLVTVAWRQSNKWVAVSPPYEIANFAFPASTPTGARFFNSSTDALAFVQSVVNLSGGALEFWLTFADLGESGDVSALADLQTERAESASEIASLEPEVSDLNEAIIEDQKRIAVPLSIEFTAISSERTPANSEQAELERNIETELISSGFKPAIENRPLRLPKIRLARARPSPVVASATEVDFTDEK